MGQCFDASGGIETGTRAVNPSNPSGAMSNIRYNTTDDYLENSFYNLVANPQLTQTIWGTLLVVDNSFAIEQYKNQLIVSTLQAGVEQQQIPDRNTGDTKFTLVSSRMDNSDTYWYLRWWDGQKQSSPRVVDYHYNIELWASNDGQWGGNQIAGSGERIQNSWSTYQCALQMVLIDSHLHSMVYVDAQ